MPQDTVLITGISGYLASYVALELFLAGYTVRGTVRNVGKAAGVKQLLQNKPLELVQVADVAESDLTEAMEGVTYVCHVASPNHFNVTDPRKDMLIPAVQGTINVLEHALKAGVKKVVITSSFAALTDFMKGEPFRDYVYTPNDWNPLTEEDACAPGAPAPIIYSTSKMLAEKAAWEFQTKHPEMTIVTCCPPMIYGPLVHACDSADQLDASSATIYKLLTSLDKLPDDRIPQSCDVRDVAKAHVLCLTEQAAANKRILLWCGENLTWDMAVRYLRSERPAIKDRLPPVLDVAPSPPTMAQLDTSIAREGLGMKFLPWQKTLLETVDSLLQLEKNRFKMEV